MESNTGLQKRLALVELILQCLKKAGGDSVQFKMEDFNTLPLLTDFDHLERTLERVQADLAPDFEYKFIKRAGGSSVTSDVKNPSYIVTGIKVIVDDISKLEEYLRAPTKNPVLGFDPNKSRLYVRGKEIKILKFSDQYHTMRIIFGDPKELSKEWFFSEIAEKIDPHKPPKRTYSNAAYQVRLKLDSAGFPNFFKTTKQSVQINPEYLS